MIITKMENLFLILRGKYLVTPNIIFWLIFEGMILNKHKYFETQNKGYTYLLVGPALRDIYIMWFFRPKRNIMWVWEPLKHYVKSDRV